MELGPIFGSSFRTRIGFYCFKNLTQNQNFGSIYVDKLELEAIFLKKKIIIDG
jgi:hypothetical protein